MAFIKIRQADIVHAISRKNEMVTLARTVTAAKEIVNDAKRYAGVNWTEIAAVENSQCDYGCKIYARRQGCVVRFAIFHSRTYGCKKG